MKSFLTMFIALSAINTDLYAAEAGMPQLDPTYWASQGFWLILIFTILYISISKFYLPKIKNNLDNRENKIKEDLENANMFKEQSEAKIKEYKVILENAKKGDLVITSDIPLAADCIKHQAYVITPTGHHFDEQNIGNARAMRDLNGYLRETGAILDQKRSFSKLDRSSFLQKMEEVLQRLKRI